MKTNPSAFCLHASVPEELDDKLNVKFRAVIKVFLMFPTITVSLD
jgi:hypothetical protein